METERPIPDLSTFDAKDQSWWKWREMGSPDDPYNQIPMLSPEDPHYKEYLDLTEAGYEAILKEYENDEGWVYWKNQEGITIHSKDHPDDPVRCFRGKGIIPATSEVLRLHLVQIDLRKYWDEMFLGGTYKIELTPTVRVCNYKFSAPWPVAPRDFVIVAGEKLTDDGLFVTVVNSIERDDIPVEEGFVRGVLKSSGYVIKPLENDPETGKPRCEITYIVQLNPMGWIPMMYGLVVVNSVNVSQPLCINTLKNAILLTEVMIKEMLSKFTDLPEEEWKAGQLRRLLNKAIDNHNGKPEMLYEPIQYVITGKRICEKDICSTLEEMGKAKSLYKMWKGSLPYLQSIANKSLHSETVRMEGFGGRRASVAEYEAFIEDRLKVDLQTVEEQTEKLLRQLNDYVSLKNNLLAIESNELKKLKTLVDLGGFYVQTEIPDTSTVFVNVGLGFHVEFTLQEALSFIEVKEAHLAKRINALGQKANGIKSHLRVMVALVNQLKDQPGA